MMIDTQIKHLLSKARLTPLHWKVWFLSAMGIFLEGYDLFVISVALPLINQEFSPSPLLQGLIASSTVLGMILGASLGGKITDKYGRRSIFMIDILFFLLFTTLSSIATSNITLIIFRFFLGVGLGADYPICASYISELMPARIRGKMLISAFSFQALGMICASIVGLFILSFDEKITSWRLMLLSGAIPGFIIMILRKNVFESPLWLLSKGKINEALAIISQLTKIPTHQISKNINTITTDQKLNESNYKILFSSAYIKKTLFASLPWFFMDVAYYAIGIFTPILISKLIIEKGTGPLSKIYFSISGAAFVDLFFIVGFILNIFFIEKLGRLKLQKIGFLGMSFGVCLILVSNYYFLDTSYHTSFILIGFIIFNLLLNLGPNATTFTIAAEIYPTEIRATGHGFAAAFAKFGAFLGILLMPIITQYLGLEISFGFILVFCVLGLLITNILGEETKGKLLS